MDVTIKFGIGNQITRAINSTGEISPSLIEALGADPARVQFYVNGAPYTGALNDGDVVELRTKANEKGKE